MSQIENDLIKKFASGEISRAKFLEQYPIDFKKEKAYIIDGLSRAYLDQSSAAVDDFLSLISFDENWTQNQKYADIFCGLLREPWHYRHEDIVTLLQGLKDPNTVDCIYEAALAKLDYMDYDESYSLARKCIHVLADIHSDKALEKLALLAESPIPIVREKAMKQLYYFKKPEN